MPVAAIVFIVFAVVLALFGLAFVMLGMSNERAYWSQRDPSGDPRTEATPFAAILKRTWHYATGEYRAPLRVVAIGIVMWWLAIACAVVAVLITVL